MTLPKTPEYTLRAMKKYFQTPKGKAARKKYYQTHKEEIKEYRKEYDKGLREECRRRGLCTTCRKTNPDKESVTCPDCRKKLAEWRMKKWKKNPKKL